jgi:hypothetical protein
MASKARKNAGERGASTSEVIEVIASAGPEGSVIAFAAPEPPAVPPYVADLIVAVADAVMPAADVARPAKFGVEFGIGTRGKGRVATLTSDPSKAMFRVFMEWTSEQRHDG